MAETGVNGGFSREVSLTAADVRKLLSLSVDQLGELTSQLQLDIGPRKNYPAYGLLSFLQLHAVGELRKLNAPLMDVAVRAARDYGPAIAAGTGWLVAARAGDGWVCVHALSPADIAGQLSLAGCALLLDLARNSESAQQVLSRRAG